MQHLTQFIHHHWQLWLALVVILIVIFIYELIALKKQAKSLTPEAVIAWMNDHQAMVIDLRAADLFKSGHIIGAIRATEADFNTPKIEKHKGKPIILVCARGIQSNALASKLRTKGYTQVMTLQGGLANWQTSNLPLVKK